MLIQSLNLYLILNLKNKKLIMWANKTRNRTKTVLNPRNTFDILQKQKNRCLFCKIKLTKDNLSIEHKTPISKGWSWELDNLCFSCVKCNFRKLDSTEKEYLEKYKIGLTIVKYINLIIL
jgi:5-methylcytosine-specific restriction endonuclease McrA